MGVKCPQLLLHGKHGCWGLPGRPEPGVQGLSGAGEPQPESTCLMNPESSQYPGLQEKGGSAKPGSSASTEKQEVSPEASTRP